MKDSIIIEDDIVNNNTVHYDIKRDAGDYRKILVVLTGGTIGSVVIDNTIDTDDKSTYILIKAYEEQYGQNAIFKVEQPYNTLSENITLEVWNALVDYLSKVKASEYKGIIITHGTDTCSYTAALLGTLYKGMNMDIPIVLVSSNYAIGEQGSNGLSNFANAVWFIEQSVNTASIKPDVYSVYENGDGVSEIFRGVEFQEADTCVDQFSAYGGQVYGTMVDGVFHHNERHVDRCEPLSEVAAYMNSGKCNQVLHADDKSANKNGILGDIRFTMDVLMIKNYPGLNYDYICNFELIREQGEKANRRLAAVIHNMYHSATSCVKCDRSNSFVEFGNRCRDNGINVYACGFKKNLENEYASMHELDDSGIKRLYDMSPEAAYANVLIAEHITCREN